MLIKRFNPYSSIGAERKIPAHHRIFYLGLLIFFLIGVCIFFLSTEKQIVTCVYNHPKNSYNCSVNSKTLLINLGTDYYNDITKAALDTRRGTCGGGTIRYSHISYPGDVYILYFVNKNGLGSFIKKLGCTKDSIFSEDKKYKAAASEINKINAFFAKNKDFVYELYNYGLVDIIFASMLIIIPLIIFVVLMCSAKARSILNEFCLHVRKDKLN